MRSERTEILVVGAGPGGAAASIGLARAGREVLLVDRADFPRPKTCGDGLTPMAVETLGRMGLLDEVLAAGAIAIDRVRITGPKGTAVEFPLAELQPGHGRALVLCRTVLDEIVRRAAVRAGATFAGRVQVERLVRKGDRVAGVEATTDAGPLAIAAEHVVLAVGAKPGLLQRAGLLETRPEPIQTARTYVSGHCGRRGCYEFLFDAELLPGYAWIFPAANGRANVGVGVVPTGKTRRRSARELLEGFIRRETDGGLLSGCEHREAVRGYPLRTDFPSGPVAGTGWAAVGEAAGLGNPVTGEGIDLALESGLLAAECIAADIAAGTADHRGYDRALRERFEAMFVGLRRIRDVLLTPVGADYSLWVMGQNRELAATLLGVAQGLLPPGKALEPWALAQLLTHLAPDLLVREMSRLRDWWASRFAGKGHGQSSAVALPPVEPTALRSGVQ